MFNFEDRIDLIFKTGFFNFQFNFSRALALPADRAGRDVAGAATLLAGAERGRRAGGGRRGFAQRSACPPPCLGLAARGRENIENSTV